MARRVSVIVPNYNHGQFLKERLDSVLNQSFRDFELIILDDCSTDNSGEVISGYSGRPNVSSIILNKKNTGNPFKQWQLGLAHASGTWVWIAESDDFADLNFLETMLNAVEGKDQVGLAYCDSVIVDERNSNETTFAGLKNKRFGTDRWDKDYFSNGRDEIENYLLPGGTINNTSAVLFHRETLLRANPFDIDLRYIGDKYTFIKVLALSNVVYVSKSLNHYRNPFNTKHTGRYVEYFYEQFRVFDWVYRNMPIKNRKKFMDGFYDNTRNSLFRGWNARKFGIYFKLMTTNGDLFWRSVIHNLGQGLRSATGGSR